MPSLLQILCKILLCNPKRHAIRSRMYILTIYLYMKRKIALLYISMVLAVTSFAQTPAFALPATYHFDREIIQVGSGKKNASDSSRFYSYYTNSGEYAGLRMQGKTANHAGWAIVTKNGNIVFFKERDKTATVISIRKIVSDLADLAKWIKMDSVMAAMRRGVDGQKSKSAKTGKTKTIDGYPAQEYSVTDSSGRVSLVWCAKVDFPVAIDYILSAGAGKWIPMISSRLESNPLLQALISPGTLVTTIQVTDSLGKSNSMLRTDAIRKVPTDFPTAGYTVIDYSNSSLMEIFHAEMRRNSK